MLKSIVCLAALCLFSTQSYAQDLFGCAIANGNMIHSVFTDDDGSWTGRFDLPSYRNLEKDPSGQTTTLNAPLTNDSLFSDNLAFTHEKQAVLEKIFGDKFSLQVKFDRCELQQSEDKAFSARFCSKSGSFKINGVALQRIEFSLQNQIRTSLVGNQGQVAQTSVVYADLLFTTTSNQNGIATAYRSSYTYFPNGDSTQCAIAP